MAKFILPTKLSDSAQNKWSYAPAFGICLIVLALASIEPIVRIFDHVSFDYGEGWNAYWADTAVQPHTALYSQAHDWISNNYPPLSFILIGWLGKLSGDTIIAGRFVAMTSLILCAIIIHKSVFVMSRSRIWSLLSAIFFLIDVTIQFRHFVGVNNPQWLAQLVLLLALFRLIQNPKAMPSPGALAQATALMILAGLIKHNLLALPLATGLWLLINDRKSCVVWVGMASAMAAIACGVLYAAYGTAIFTELLGYKRTSDFANFYLGLSILLGLTVIVILGAFAFWSSRKGQDRRWTLLFLYTVFGFVLGGLARIGAGVEMNVQYEALIGGVILCGAFLGSSDNWAKEALPSQRIRLMFFYLMLFPMALALPRVTRESYHRLSNRIEHRAQWAQMIADLKNSDRPAICEVLAACYWAGKPMTLDFFSYGQKLDTGASPADLTNYVSTRQAKIIVLDRGLSDVTKTYRLPPPIPTLISRNYAPVRFARTGVPDDTVAELIARD